MSDEMKLRQRYSSPFAWAVWALLEMPAALVGVILSMVSRGFRWCSLGWFRHVYYVFTRLARWVDGKPGWREVDQMIGVMPPERIARVRNEEEAQWDAWWKGSVERGRTLLEKPLSFAEIEAMDSDDRTAIANAIVSLGGNATVVEIKPG